MPDITAYIRAFSSLNVNRANARISPHKPFFLQNSSHLITIVIDLIEVIILFQKQPRRIVIIAVMHLNRDPGYWKNR